MMNEPLELDKFFSYHWPGNIRELEHVLERACVLTETGVLKEEDFHFFTSHLMKSKLYSADKNPMKMTDLAIKKATIEKIAFIRALEENGGNKTKAAKSLHISRSQFYDKLRKYKL